MNTSYRIDVTPETTKHTPWKLTGMGRLVDATGNPITLPPLDEGSTQSDWNALETIVLCVNSHDRLAKACERLIQWADALESEAAQGNRTAKSPPILEAEAALAAAQPKP